MKKVTDINLSHSYAAKNTFKIIETKAMNERY